MRIIVMFDLPLDTLEDKREYRKFRKFLVKRGFLMMQESIYCKLALNQTMAGIISNAVKVNKPPHGIVQLLTITEKQYSRMEYIVGDSESEVIDSDDRVVIL